ncbi:MAG: 1-acyl-sn-glycerol-3-phosphate acyltransferase, partial [Leptospiraceae bacterium]|nr:1-acyl-sn-glycerol-3-phosphate acyltransferase [Leptospiraceae bacterium]
MSHTAGREKVIKFQKNLEGNSFESPKERKRIFWDKLFLGSRIYFVVRYLYITYQMSKLAKQDKYHHEEFMLHGQYCYDLLLDVGAKFHIDGIDNIKKIKDEPVVFISNHMSTLETMILPILILPFKKIIFVVKKSLLKVPLFGNCIKATKPISLGRVNPREDLKAVMEEGMNAIQSGTSVVIFQQGHRKPFFDHENFSSIGVKLAQKAKVKIVPIAIKTDFWGNGKMSLTRNFGRIKRKEKVYICFGEPMEIQGNGKDTNPKIIEFIQGKLSEWNHNPDP